MPATVRSSLVVLSVVCAHVSVVLAVAALAACSSPVNADCTGRRDTPWCRMSDGELADEIAKAGGRVFIGFKDPGAATGVDEYGHVLVSDAVVTDGKAQLRALGVVIEFEYIDVPAVEALMSAQLLGKIRHNPVVEYVEPIFPGTFVHETSSPSVVGVLAP